jgi:hypothetical protein
MTPEVTPSFSDRVPPARCVQSLFGYVCWPLDQLVEDAGDFNAPWTDFPIDDSPAERWSRRFR